MRSQTGAYNDETTPNVMHLPQTSSSANDRCRPFEKQGPFDHSSNGSGFCASARLTACCQFLRNQAENTSLTNSVSLPDTRADGISRVRCADHRCQQNNCTGQCMSRVNPDVLLAWCEAPSHFLPPELPAAPAQHSQSAGAPQQI
jgi:hypothetical protein